MGHADCWRIDYVVCWRMDYVGCWRTGHGDHRPTEICHANYSRTGSPCPVLQHPTVYNRLWWTTEKVWDVFGIFWIVERGRLAAYAQNMNTNKQPHPLPAGEGSKYPCFLLEDGARRPRPTMVCLAYHMNSSLFVLHSSLNYATVLL